MNCKILSLVILIVIAYSCTNNQQTQNISNADITNDYAVFFQLNEQSDSFRLEILKPWQGAHQVVYNYEFVPHKPESLHQIQIPVQRIVCMSATQIGLLSAIEAEDIIAGISGSQYISNPILLKGIENEQVYDVGYAPNIDYETLLSIDPDLILLYGVGAEIARIQAKLQELKIPTMIFSEYLEEHPLGKLEWIKVLGALTGKYEQSVNYFNTEVQQYNSIKTITDTILNKPLVMTGLPWRGTWYIPGNKSNLAQIIHDAGGKYLWNDLEGNEVHPLNIENVFDRGITADVWINSGVAVNLKDIRNTDLRLVNLPVYKQQRIYNNNKLLNNSGNNSYFEIAIAEPHLVLRDLVQVFYPEINLGDKKFYQQLSD